MTDRSGTGTKGAPRGIPVPKSGAGAPQGDSPIPADRVLEALVQAVGVVTNARPEATAVAIRDDLDTMFEGLIPAPTCRIPADICAKPEPSLGGFCHQLKLSRQQAELTFAGSKDAATSALRAALGAWSLALNEHEFALAVGDASLRQSATEVVRAFQAKDNADSQNRSLSLYFTMKETAAIAIQSYEATAMAAGATLTEAAGALLTAHQAYLGALAAAQSQRLSDEASADRNFWEQVEAARDAV